MKYTHKAFVRWDDLDAFGHVNNAKYLTMPKRPALNGATHNLLRTKRAQY